MISPLISQDFWLSMDALVRDHSLVIDRPKGSAHPRFPTFIYPLDYGYLAGTSAADKGGIDVFCGQSGQRAVVGIAVTLDTQKKDSEIKILLGCSTDEIDIIYRFLNSSVMKALIIGR